MSFSRVTCTAVFAASMAISTGVSAYTQSDLVGVGAIANETAWAEGTNWEYVSDFKGQGFNAWVYTPEVNTKKVTDKQGVVFHLMGCGQEAFQVAQGAGWDQVADTDGFIIVVPEPTKPAKPNQMAKNVECYDYGSSQLGMSYSSGPDQDLIAAAARVMAGEEGIDADQIYVSGLSAGAAAATQVACKAPDVFSGIGVAAAPAMGSAQAYAIRAPGSYPQVSTSASSIANLCNSSAGSNKDMLKDFVVVVVSDDNSTPQGSAVQMNGVWTMDIFMEETVWDGDKFCPHVYNEMNAEAFAQLIGVGSPAETDAPIYDSEGEAIKGVGIGCADEIDPTNPIDKWDGTSETPAGYGNADQFGAKYGCEMDKAVYRNWEAKAKIWRDSEGRDRVIQIEMDTLRHAWPTGKSALTSYLKITPTYNDLFETGIAYRAPVDYNNDGVEDDFNGDGVVDETDYKVSAFDIDKSNGAKNGALGVVYFNPMGFAYSEYLAKTWTANNPKLPEGPVNSAPVVVELTAGEVDGGIQVSTVVSDSDADDALVAATISIENTTTGADPVEFAIDFSGEVSEEVITKHFGDLEDGIYKVAVTATDTKGAVGTKSINVTFGDVPNQRPTVDSLDVSYEDGCLKLTGTASDVDGEVAQLVLTEDGKDAVTTEAGSSFSAEICEVEVGQTYSGEVVVVDNIGDESSNKMTFTATIPEGGECETVTGYMYPLRDDGYLVEETVWFSKTYTTTGDEQEVALVYTEITLYLDADGKSYVEDPGCQGELVSEVNNEANDIEEEGEGEIEEGVVEGEGEIEEGVVEGEGEIEEGVVEGEGEIEEGVVEGEGEIEEGVVEGEGEIEEGVVEGEGEIEEGIVEGEGEIEEGIVEGEGEIEEGVVEGEGEIEEGVVEGEGEIEEGVVEGEGEIEEGVVEGEGEPDVEGVAEEEEGSSDSKGSSGSGSAALFGLLVALGVIGRRKRK